MPVLPALTTSSTSVTPASDASSTTNCSAGVVTIGASSFGTAFVSGRKRVPRPAAGISALWTRGLDISRGYLGENLGMSAMDGSSGDKARLRSDLLAARQARSPEDLATAR